MRQRLLVGIMVLCVAGGCWVLTNPRRAPTATATTAYRANLPLIASGPSPTPTPSPRPPEAPAQSARRPWRSVRNWVYWLNSPNLDAIKATNYNLAVIDYSRDGTASGRFTASEIASLRSTGCQRRVLAYLSIGQAEQYRSYWMSGWRVGNPSWLVAADPDWPENYYVRYWDPEWQAIVYNYLDQILAAGFDGVYLDRVDAYTQAYATGREADMKAFVAAIAAYARARSPLGDDFGVFPQNAEALGSDPAYVAITTGIGVEELYYRSTNRNVPESERTRREALVRRFRDGARGGLVLTVDYTDQSDKIRDAYARSARNGFVPYVANTELDRLFVHPGNEPGCGS
ncbi:MAG: MJ1477/TM1410 family putative glycoside hydrolase [Chloroflexaceae bacterium]